MLQLQDAPTMAKKKAAKTSPVRLTEDAIRWVKRASGLTEETIGEYASRVLVERAMQDFEQLSEAIKKEKPKR